ncbi:MAG: hypothetical protein JW776_05200 [Candidatus Lokiarchaeota archaeon]|nr:hypothetical protein [Candidatus Lokiarchaeota archaeon]
MDFSDKSENSPEKCMICMDPAWIHISIIENKEKTDKFVCVSHYIVFLKQFLSDELDESIILFTQNSKMLEIPLYEAMERFGGLNERVLLENYITFLENKIQIIDEELSGAGDLFFKTLLKNEKQDKLLRLLLAKARIKCLEL